MRFLRFVSCVFIVLLPAALAVSGGQSMFPFSDTSFLYFSETPAGKLFPLLQFGSNAFSLYRFEPLTAMATAALGPAAYFSVWYGILSVSLFAALRWFSMLSPVHGAAVGSLASLVILSWFGFDLAMVSTLAATAMQLAAAGSLLGATRVTSLQHLVLLAVGLFCASACSQLAVLPASIALLALALSPDNRDKVLPFGVAVGIPALVASVFTPPPELPAYPFNGHVVTHYGTADGLFPLIGPSPQVLLVDRAFIRTMLVVPALSIVCLLSVLAVVSGGRGPRPAGSRARLFLALIIAVSVVLDSALLPVNTTQISPVQSLTRIVPGWYFISLPTILLGVLIVLIGVFGTLNRIALAVTALAFGLFCTHSGRLLAQPDDVALWMKARAEPNDALRREYTRILSSPSYSLVKEYGLGIIRKRPFIQSLQYRPVIGLHPVVTASAGAEQTAAAVDNVRETAWSSRTGKQIPGQWLHLHFSEPIPAGGIRMETGPYFTDFPRGLEVSVSSACDGRPEGFADYKKVHPARANEGSVQFTEDGFPYFSPQYATSIAFEPGTVAQCILIRQTRTEENFDWSVSEVLLASPS